MKLRMTERLLVLLIVGIAASSGAATIIFPAFSIDVGTDWKYRVEERTPLSDEWGELISIYRPDEVGVLKMKSYVAPKDVSQVVLRNLTNVEASTKLRWQDWGDLSGYQYSYTERGSFYKQWWLTNGRTMLFITYECDAGAQQIEFDAIDKMISSIRIDRR
jgi:hypothetical protein